MPVTGTRRRSRGGGERHQLPAAGTADVRIVAADAATADAILAELTARFPALADADRYPAGPSGARTGTRLYVTVTVDAPQGSTTVEL